MPAIADAGDLDQLAEHGALLGVAETEPEEEEAEEKPKEKE